MRKKLLPLFLSQSLRSVAISLLSFFSVIFIFRRALDIYGNQRAAFLLTFALFAVLYFFKIIGTSLAENLALKYGLKTQIIIGHWLTGLALLAFAASGHNFDWLWGAQITWGLAIGFFWFGRHALVVKMGEQGQFGKAIGFSGLIENFLLLGTPFLGGVIISQFGYNILFLFSLAFIILALLVLKPLVNERTHRDTTIKEALSIMLNHKRMALAYLSLGATDTIYAEGLVLFIFLNIKEEMGIGIFFSLSMVVVALINYLICNSFDSRGKKGFIRGGAILSGLVWLGRSLITSPMALLLFDIVNRVAGGMTAFPLEALSFQKAIDGQSTGRAILFRELVYTLGNIFGVGLMVGVFFLNLPFKTIFLLAAPLAFCQLLVIKKTGIYGEN